MVLWRRGSQEPPPFWNPDYMISRSIIVGRSFMALPLMSFCFVKIILVLQYEIFKQITFVSSTQHYIKQNIIMLKALVDDDVFMYVHVVLTVFNDIHCFLPFKTCISYLVLVNERHLVLYSRYFLWGIYFCLISQSIEVNGNNILRKFIYAFFNCVHESWCEILIHEIHH